MILIGGDKNFGSGKIVSNIKTIMDDKFTDFIFFRTNGVVFGIIRLVKLIKSSENVIFQPSIYGYSVLRDFLIFCILRLLKRHYSILLLCDLEASKLPKLAEFIIMHKLCQKVFSSASPTNLALKEQVLFRQLEQDWENYVNHKFIKNINFPLNEIEMIYGNYLSKEKGLENFYSLLNQRNIKRFMIFGERRSNDIHNSNYNEYVTSSEKDFLQCFKSVKDDNKCQCYFYGSMYDLSPLVIEIATASGFPIITLKGSAASKILATFLSPFCFFEISDSQTTIDTAELHACWKNARALIKSRPSLIECF